jgi:exopolysaccharide biosynthesis polyprenyl glycosylphosphotransferase
VSSSLLNPKQQEAQTDGWARLIPGEGPGLRQRKKPSQPVQSAEFGTVKVTEILRRGSTHTLENRLALLVPAPFRNRAALRWLRSTTTDFALVGLNWLLIGALLVPLKTLCPYVRLFAFAPGVPGSLPGIALLHAALITLMGYTEGLYTSASDLPHQARILGKSVLWATTLLCFAYGLQGAAWTMTGLLCAAGGLNFGALWAWRWQSASRQRRTKPGDRDMRNVLIVGAGAVGRSLAAYVQEHSEIGRTFRGFLDNERPVGNGVIGQVCDLPRLARTEFVDEVILAAPHSRELTVEVLRAACGLRLDVEMVPELFGCKPEADEVEHVGSLPVICLHAERLPAAGLVLKRLVDVVGAGVALTALSPLLAVIASLIKLDSPGPVLYRALRAGRKARPFVCYKFRTMVSNADTLKDDLRKSNQRSGPFFKIVDDPRITRLGHFLRRYSLDELPQLWNVLRGDMSLVGPRPHPLDDLAGYEAEHLARLDVTPGLTGLWQVTARRDPSFERGMDLDREYIRSWSLASDLRILLKTVVAVVQGSGT